MIVVVGGGTAALEFVLALKALIDVDVTLVAPEVEYVPRPLLVAEPLGNVPRVRRKLAELAREFGFEHVRGAVSAVEDRQVTLRGGGALAYDTLVLAPGAKRLPAFDEAIHLGDDDSQLTTLREEIEAGTVRTVAVVAPTSVGWLHPLYEAALLLAQRGARVTFTGAASEDVRQVLEQAGVAFTQERPDADRLVTLPLIRGPRIPGVPETGLYGLIPVDEHLRVEGLADVYAIGDATDYPIKQGAIACQMADAAAAHVAQSLGAPVSAEPFSARPTAMPEFGKIRIPGQHLRKLSSGSTSESVLSG